MQKENLLEIFENYIFGNSFLNENELAEKIQLNPRDVKDFFMHKPEEWGFIPDSNSIFFAHELIREKLNDIKEAFWNWYVKNVPSYSDLAWEEGADITDTSQIKVYPSRELKGAIIQTFTARIVILGDEKTGKQSYVYSLTGEIPNRPAPGVFFGKISRPTADFVVDFESIILDVPPESPSWIYAKASFGVILVFDVTNPSSFDRLFYWVDTFLDSYSYDLCPPIMILGNKIDLIDQSELKEFKKKTEQLREQIEKEYGTIVISELISLTDGINVLGSFENFAKVIRQWYQIIKEEYSNDNPMM